MKLIDNWKVQFHRLWCIRLSLFVGVLTGVAAVIGAFTDVFNPWFLLGISIVANTALIPLARLLEQGKPPQAAA